MKVQIAVAYHKEWPYFGNEVFVPVQVGRVRANKVLPIQGDDYGDNISSLNPYYCEMTATYYLWKNCKADYKGLCHYRRFFSFEKETLISHLLSNLASFITKIYSLFKPGLNFTKTHSEFLNIENSLDTINHSEKIILKYLKSNDTDIICTKNATPSTRSVFIHFSHLIGLKAMTILDNLMKDSPLYPYYKKILEGNSYTYGNMVIMKTVLFDEYCNFIFPILEAHYKQLRGCEEYDNPAYSRVTGYVAEILTATFIASKKTSCSIKKMSTIFIDRKPNNLPFYKNILLKNGFFHPILFK